MNNYCKHLKKRKNKPYCNILKQEITLSQCQECDKKEYHFPVKGKIDKMKNKSNKLAKMERNRKSVFTDDLKHCYLCGNKKDDLHELLGGRNRLNCIRLGYIIPVCRLCHSRIQNDNEFKMYWAKKVQLHYEDNIGTREDFVRIFRRNYLD